MNFLEEATGTPRDRDTDDLSSISNSLQTPLKDDYSSLSRQYVWDQIGQGQEEEQDRIPIFRHQSTTSSLSSKSSLKTNFDEVKRKITLMKGELKIKNQTIKDLQSELSRLVLARGKESQ